MFSGTVNLRSGGTWWIRANLLRFGGEGLWVGSWYVVVPSATVNGDYSGAGFGATPVALAF